MPDEFPAPPITDYAERSTTWGNGLFGKTKRHELFKEGRVAVSRPSRRLVIVHERAADAMRRIAAENAAAAEKKTGG